MAITTLFEPNSAGGGGGGSAGDYVKDAFQDISRPASNNTGFTSNASTNPLGFSYANTDAPQYGVKTLFIRGLKPITDKTLWINSKPTFEVLFTEDFPQVKAYAFGNARILDVTTGFSLNLINIGDGIGVGGNIRQVAWILNTATATGDVTPSLDGVTSSTLSFGGAANDSTLVGVNKYNTLLQSASLASNDLHDFRIIANQENITRVVGLMVYFQNTASNIEARPGDSFVDKTLVTTTSAVGVTLPTVTSDLGSKVLVLKTAAATYALNSLETPAPITIGQGLSGTNLMSVTTGQGATFPTGALVMGVAGTSHYFSLVSLQSTDTLTMSATLPYGFSGPLYRYGFAGSTFAIGATLHKPYAVLDSIFCEKLVEPQSFGVSTGVLFYSDPNNRFRVWGSGLTVQTANGQIGFGFLGATTGFLQIDGRFSALDFTHASSGIFHATFCINGQPGYGINAGYSGVFKKTILADSGDGWNSVVMYPGASLSVLNNVVTNFTLYERVNPGVTTGVLAQFAIGPTYTQFSSAVNASLMPIGSYARLYADQLAVKGAWSRATAATYAGGVAYAGASTNSTLSFQYYGTDFALIGTAGGSMTCTLDGSSIAYTFNVTKPVGTLGWHSVALQYNAGATCLLQAVDFAGPRVRQLQSTQKYVASDGLIAAPVIYEQSMTPQGARNGDFWLERPAVYANGLPSVWLKIQNLWNKLAITQTSDDPQMGNFYKYAGTSTGASSGGVDTMEMFNFISWSSLTTVAPAARSYTGYGDQAYNGELYIVGGITVAGAIANELYAFNKVSWRTPPTGGTIWENSNCQAFGLLYRNKGATTSSAGSRTGTCTSFNGTATSSMNNYANARGGSGSFVVNSIIYSFAGVSSGGSNDNTNETRNAADSVGSATVVPASSSFGGGSGAFPTSGIATAASGSSANTDSYVWNGSSWSANIAMSYSSTAGANGFSYGRGRSVYANGSTPVNTAGAFNGTAWSAVASSSTARSHIPGGVI